LLVAADTTAIEATIADIKSKGVLVIALDTPVKNDDTDALFATNNFVAGTLIGQYAKAALGNKAPKIIALDGPDGLTVSDLRHNGFVAGFTGSDGGTGASGDAGGADAGSVVGCHHATVGDAMSGQTAA